MKRTKFYSGLIALVLMLSFSLLLPLKSNDVIYAQTSELTTAKAMMVLEASSLRPLYFHNESEKLPMASTTKIITAFFVIENNEDLDKVIEIPKEAVGIEGTSIGLKEGEHLTIRELLYGLMLRSGNDSAVALAIATCGSVENFVVEVNKYLKERGLKDTSLANPHGLDHKDHYTTASDLAKITAYALNNETFSEIVGTKQKLISNEKKTKTSRNLINKNKLLKNYEYADGVKTGFTKKAGRCFVGSATKDGMRLVCVLLNCNPMFEECEYLLNKGFNEYKMHSLLKKDDLLSCIKIEGANQDKLQVRARASFMYPLKESELHNIKMKVSCPKSLSAPIKEGELLGEVEINLENQLIFSDKIYSILGVKPNTFEYYFNRIVEQM